MFARVPWVAIFKRSITLHASEGYYIVFLFAEDMSSVTISLNQSYTAFKQRYAAKDLAYLKLEDCARAAYGEVSSAPQRFRSGRIDLHTNGDLAKGYEVGAILSRTYFAEAMPSMAEIESDVRELLNAYLKLASRYPSTLIGLDVGVAASELSDAVHSLSAKAPPVASTTGPQPRTAMGKSRGRDVYVRSPDIAARALAIAKSSCALSTANDPHTSFTSARTQRNYVEAHHLILFSLQSEFEHSLDVEENIAALCPNCHRMLHYGRAAEKVKALKFLHDARSADLRGRGIDVDFDRLKKMYKSLSEED